MWPGYEAKADHNIAISTSRHSQALEQTDELKDCKITFQGIPWKSNYTLTDGKCQTVY